MTKENADWLVEFAVSAEILAYAKLGDLEPLARHIDTGGEITPDIRAFLAGFLRGKFRKTKRGPAPLKVAADRRAEVAFDIWWRAAVDGVSIYKAQQEYAEKTDLNLSTVETWCLQQGVTHESVLQDRENNQTI